MFALPLPGDWDVTFLANHPMKEFEIFDKIPPIYPHFVHNVPSTDPTLSPKVLRTFPEWIQIDQLVLKLPRCQETNVKDLQQPSKLP